MKHSPKLQVWGVNLMLARGQRRCIVAARSRTAAARLMKVSAHHLKWYGAVTGNEREVSAALAKQGIVLTDVDGCGFVEVEL